MIFFKTAELNLNIEISANRDQMCNHMFKTVREFFAVGQFTVRKKMLVSVELLLFFDGELSDEKS